ncbi:MAG: hypothetical protein M1376_16395 [Planctomycetes bacterium]|nr:hypothetical protein [Planctomycetota bacterium]
MKPNPNLDELLSSFMDGELSPRQRTEVQRMATRDAQVARRLQQLQNCRSLFRSLPVEKAPNDLLEQIRVSLERHSLLQEQPVVRRRSIGAWQLAFRRLVAAAAVLVLMGVLGVVVYQIVSPAPQGAVPLASDTRSPSGGERDRTTVIPLTVADAGFTGRLELRTARLAYADTFVARAIENSGLSGQDQSDLVGNKRVYRVTGTRESVQRLVASLSGVWQNFEGAVLQVDRPENAATPVVVEGVTPEEAAGIVAQNSTQASLEAAAGYAVMNRVAKAMPGGEFRPLIQDDPSSLLAALSIPRPRETGPEPSTPVTGVRPEGKAQVSLTIVLKSTM